MKHFTNELIIRAPDDWHLHLRENEILKHTIKYSYRFYKRAVIMPNLKNPITTSSAAIKYRKEILKSVKKNKKFQPLMTCYLTDISNPDDIEFGFHQKIFFAAKLYPINTTTNSALGVTDFKKIVPVLDRMQKIGMPLLVHGEILQSNVDIYDREAYFIDYVLDPMRKQFPELKITFEHISTKEAVSYVKDSSAYLGATITPHHLIMNRNDMFYKGLRPHIFCFPILKSYEHQKSLRKIIASGNKKFFLGTDNAPHFNLNKENYCASPGIFNALVSLPIYATVFEEMNALKYFQSFCSENGPIFYKLPLNKDKIKLIRQEYKVPLNILINDQCITPFLCGKTLRWSMNNT